MKLLKIKLDNYCQYDNLNIDFNEGITILRGRNGSGKSNFINSIFFALTGGSCIDKKTRSGMLKWGSDKGFVELSFEIADKKYKIKRFMNSSSVKLTGVTLEKPITGSNEATKFITNLMKADADVLKISSFMPQDGAKELVFGTKTERQLAFSRLFRLLHLESIRTELQKEFNKIPVYPDVTDMIESLSAEVAILEGGLADIDIDKHTSYLEDNKDKYNNMYAVKDIVRTEKEYKDELERLQANLILTESSKEQAEKDFASLPKTVNISQEESEKYRRFKLFTDTCNKMLELEENTKTPAKVEEEVTQEQLDKAKEEHTALQKRVLEISRELSLWKEGKCDKCGSEFPHTEDEIAKKESELVEVKEALSNNDTLLMKYEQIRYAMHDAERKNQEQQLQLSKAKEEVIAGYAEFGEYDPSIFEKKLEESSKNAEIDAKRNALMNKINAYVTEHASITSSISSVKAAGFKPSDFSMEFLTEYSSKQAAYNELLQKKASIETALKIKKEQLVSRKNEQKLAKVAEEHRKFITDMRTVLHVDNYPRLAVALKKEKLGIIISKYLAIFNQAFTVNINDSLEFKCSFADNPEADAGELSGGQKAMLLVSVRFAIAEMLAHNVELLTFDEPGSAMDKEAKQDLLEAFDIVRRYLSGQRIQMLVASHDDNIEDIADSVINI